ncbi:MAG: GAF domain-containing protein [Candidatus Manganitrophaceae bacterium]|nr:MAG: GAF domain-containing protein [Candidatus Manganitrophaceae bacterium]
MNKLTEQILSLRDGDHLCLIYEKDPAEQMPALVPFIKQGLETGEQCIYIADDQTVDQVTGALQSGGVDVARERNRGALLLWTREEWRQPGELDSEKKAAQVRRFIDAALSAGFSGIRFAVEMTWTLGPDISAARLKHWEATINRIFVPGFPGRIVCQYSRSRLPAAVVETSLSTHPLVILGPQVSPNPFYEASLILDGPSEAGKLNLMLSELTKAHQQTERKDRERYRRLRQIYELNNRVNRAEALEEIYKASLDTILQLVGADRAAILLADDDQVMRFKSWVGLSEAYRGAVEGHSPWRPDTPDPEPVCIPDIDRAPLEDPLREVVRHEGIRALGFFPLVYQRQLLGKFMVYYDTPHPFLEEEVQLTQTIAGHVAFSIQSKRMEEELRRKTIEAQAASRLKSQLVSNVSHELRTPLNAILGYTHLILGEIYGPLGEDQKSALEGVVRNGDELLNLINNLLDFSKIESGKLSVETEPVDLPALLEDILSRLKPLLEKGALYSRYEHRPLPVLQSDANKIRQVLVNLLSNAIKFTPQGGITVETADQPERGGVEIRMKDTGIGIKPEDLPKIFEAFHQIDSAATRKFEGSGLGLTIVKQLVDLLKGEIRVESEFGKGSTFILFLPYRLN